MDQSLFVLLNFSVHLDLLIHNLFPVLLDFFVSSVPVIPHLVLLVFFRMQFSKLSANLVLLVSFVRSIFLCKQMKALLAAPLDSIAKMKRTALIHVFRDFSLHSKIALPACNVHQDQLALSKACRTLCLARLAFTAYKTA